MRIRDNWDYKFLREKENIMYLNLKTRYFLFKSYWIWVSFIVLQDKILFHKSHKDEAFEIECELWNSTGLPELRSWLFHVLDGITLSKLLTFFGTHPPHLYGKVHHTRLLWGSFEEMWQPGHTVGPGQTSVEANIHINMFLSEHNQTLCVLRGQR